MAFTLTDPASILYEGTFRGKIDDNVEVTGHGTVTLSRSGLPKVDVRVDHGSESAAALRQAYLPNGVIDFTSRVTWRSATVEAEHGRFEMTHQPHLANLQFDSVDGVRLGIEALRAEYRLIGAGAPTYWSLPIYNLLWDSGPVSYPELINHPMWFPHNRNSEIVHLLPPAVIGFLFDGRPAFIQRVADYPHRKASLESGESRHLVTAVMIGEVGERSFEFAMNDRRSWFPTDLLPWLTFATSRRVGAPWIELHDADGNLVRRVHLSFGVPDLRPEVARVDNRIPGRSIGALLTSVMQSAAFGSESMSIPLIHLNKCITRGDSLEDRKDYLARAIERIANDHGLARQDLAALSDAAKAAVKQQLRESATALRRLSDRYTSDGNTLQLIAAKVQSAAGGKDSDFGTKVADIAAKYGLPDQQVLDDHFRISHAPSEQTWPGRLSVYRNHVIHEGYLRLDSAGGTFPLGEAGSIVDHLEDLLVRVMLKMAAYTGLYKSMIRGPLCPEPVPIDWVTSGASPADLGFASVR